LAAAQAGGLVDGDAARVIRRCLDRLPAELALRHGPQVEAEVEAVLVDAATRVDARALAQVGERVLAHLDPDGRAPAEQAIRARRGLELTTSPDGTGLLTGQLTRELTATLTAVLDPLSAPTPATADGTPDPRTATQRRHDALLDACTRLLRAGTLPDAGGVPTTILLTIEVPTPHPGTGPRGRPSAATTATGRGDPGTEESDAKASGAEDSRGRAENVGAAPRGRTTRQEQRPDWARPGAQPPWFPDTAARGTPPWFPGSPQGSSPPWFAVTPAGGLIPLDVALRLADQAEIYTLLTTPAGGILAGSRTRRLATPAQRRALAARDRGCSFPDCTRPPAWCEAHHIIAWIDGGPTTVENMTLLCGFHHHEHERLGWTCHMHPTDRVPEWTPPPHLDPAQQPRRNTAHHILRQ
jgi:hypothetical protein